MHMFNSKSVLDGLDIENLPIGLFGDFYSHELTFFLIKNNDLKNLKNIFYKNNLKIKKILLKDFVEGADLIKQNNDTETFFKIKVNKTTTNLNFFEKSSFRFAQNFSFGSNIILNDISKVCSISHEMIQKILSSNSLNNINSDNDLIEKEYFVKSNYRKIRKKLIMEIVDARIEEICKIVLNKNINIQSFLNNYKGKVYITISDNIITKNFRENLNFFFLTNKNFETKFIHMIEPKEKMLSINSVADLTFYGWRKEAIPITQTKSSLITRIFKSLFD